MTNFQFVQSSWNRAPLSVREHQLRSINCNPVLANRAYAYIPKWIRQDLERHIMKGLYTHA